MMSESFGPDVCLFDMSPLEGLTLKGSHSKQVFSVKVEKFANSFQCITYRTQQRALQQDDTLEARSSPSSNFFHSLFSPILLLAHDAGSLTTK